AALAARLRDASGLPLPVLSMGMTGDFEAAIAAGSTMVRVGTGVFGPR
ncbi:MAG TPA: YggS family pyridoxal phosphate-dependent enzyme, partial [Planctomycetota bacterium]|nr:YggS family pyridoxal phosphate-dependent enzyme [Planctomycetota bacterium]